MRYRHSVSPRQYVQGVERLRGAAPGPMSWPPSRSLQGSQWQWAVGGLSLPQAQARRDIGSLIVACGKMSERS
eukprot:scaffold325692_cov57-Tisochrysis_lutea.AAC.1